MFTICMVTYYGIERVIILYNLEEYSIAEAEKDFYYTPFDQFTHKDGFRIAVGITSYDGS